MIDTNVLIAALRSRRGDSYRLLSLIEKGKFEYVLSCKPPPSNSPIRLMRRSKKCPGAMVSRWISSSQLLWPRGCRLCTLWIILRRRGARSSPEAFERALNEIPDVEPDEYDRL